MTGETNIDAVVKAAAASISHDAMVLANFPAKTQAFFEAISAETRKASYGDLARNWTAALLIRAQEAGLFRP